jgi:hypothetical protein
MKKHTKHKPLISLITCLVLVAVFIVWSIFKYRQAPPVTTTAAALNALFAGVLSYALTGLIFDVRKT